MDSQGWWGILLQGTIASGFGGAVAAVTAWAVVTVTHRHEHRFALRMEARKHAVEMFHMVGELRLALEKAHSDAAAELPTTQSREWLVRATSLEIAMYSVEGPIGPSISQDIGDLRRAVEALEPDGEVRRATIEAAKICARRLTDDLADWLMDGRHRSTSNEAQSPAVPPGPDRSLNVGTAMAEGEES